MSANIGVMQHRLEQVNDGGLDALDRSWKLRDKLFPYSCTDEEGLIIWSLITGNRLTSGYEVATAFGYSTIYAALAMKCNGGTIRTLDCYVEEASETFTYSKEDSVDAVAQVRLQVANGVLPNGMQYAASVAQSIGVAPEIQFSIGLSPDDVGPLLEGRFLDYVLIDGGHFEGQPTSDFLAVCPFLSERIAVLFHDNNSNPYVAAAIETAERHFGCRSHRFNTRYGLTLVGRDLNPRVTSGCDRICIRNHRAGLFRRILSKVLG